MSYQINKHEKDFQSKYLQKLKKADIIFTTTDQEISKRIKKLAKLKISHCNLFIDNKKLIETSVGVKGKLISQYFQESKMTRAIGFQNHKLSDKQRKKIFEIAKQFIGVGYDMGQLVAHGVAAGATILMGEVFEAKDGKILSRKDKLDVKRDLAKTYTPYTKAALDGYNKIASWVQFFKDPVKNKLPLSNDGLKKELKKYSRYPKNPEFLMCSTLIVMAYQGAGIKFDMKNSKYIGTDDLYHFCKKNYTKKFDISFTNDEIIENK